MPATRSAVDVVDASHLQTLLGWKCPAELFLPVGEFDFKAYWAKQLKLNPVALGG